MYVEWRWEWSFEILPQMLWATLNTFLAAGVGYAIAAIVGILFMLGQRTSYKIINIPTREIVEFIRSILINSFSLGVCYDDNRTALWNISFRSLQRST